MPERHTVAITFNVGDWTIEPAANRMIRAGQEVHLEPKVMRLLAYLVERHGEVVSRHDLEANVWTGMIVTDDAVTNAVIKLRKALGDDARNPTYIATIPKRGYRLIAKVHTAPDVPSAREIGTTHREPGPEPPGDNAPIPNIAQSPTDSPYKTKRNPVPVA